MKDPYLTCYMAGRMDEYEGAIDTAMLVAKIVNGSPVRDTSMEAAKKAITAEMDSATKMAWLKDNLDDIRAMGSDTEKAWRMFCLGRTDALAATLEDEAMEEIVNQLEEEESDEDEEDPEDSDEEEESDGDEDDLEEDDEE